MIKNPTVTADPSYRELMNSRLTPEEPFMGLNLLWGPWQWDKALFRVYELAFWRLFLVVEYLPQL